MHDSKGMQRRVIVNRPLVQTVDVHDGEIVVGPHFIPFTS